MPNSRDGTSDPGWLMYWPVFGVLDVLEYQYISINIWYIYICTVTFRKSSANKRAEISGIAPTRQDAEQKARARERSDRSGLTTANSYSGRE